MLYNMFPRMYKKFIFYTLSLIFIYWLVNKYFTLENLDPDTFFDDEEEFNSSVPTLLWWTDKSSYTRIIHCEDDITCNVVDSTFEDRDVVSAYLFYGSNIETLYGLPVPRKPDTLWGLFHEESPRNVEQLMHEEILELFNYSATFSRYSDVPFPLHYVVKDLITSTKHYLPTAEKNLLLGELAPVLFIQSDCNTATERDEYVIELMQHIKVDSYGGCLNNKELSELLKYDYLNNLYSDEFIKFSARYKFVVAIENGVCDDYITEKLWRPIFAGSLPIYFGSPTVYDWLPNPKSAILLKDHPNPKLMAQYLKTLLKNDTLYEEYLEHKIEGKISNELLLKEIEREDFTNEFDKQIKNFECHMCRKAHEQKNGNLKSRTVNKFHYNCPEPVSALTLKVNQYNSWVSSWNYSKNQEIRQFLKWYHDINNKASNDFKLYDQLV